MHWMLGLTVLVLLQAALIAALLIERRRWHRTSAQARHLAAEFTRMLHLAVLAEIATSVSSQIVQPVTAMLINVETAIATLRSREPRLQTLREILADVQFDCERVADVLHRLRDRPLSHEPELRSLDVNVAIGNVLTLITIAAQRHGIEVKAELASGVRPIEADSTQILGVVLSLCMNAIEVMKRAPNEPHVLTIMTATSERSVSVCVHDNAPGLPAQRVPSPIAERIVESHGGRLWMNPGADGTTFGFAIPILGER
jgi:C4-dicarboxylate-specific signal transduction histidine kinase